jgi:hypothetical protein
VTAISDIMFTKPSGVTAISDIMFTKPSGVTAISDIMFTGTCLLMYHVVPGEGKAPKVMSGGVGRIGEIQTVRNCMAGIIEAEALASDTQYHQKLRV